MNPKLEKIKSEIQLLIQKDGRNPVLSLELLKKIQFERANFSYAKISRFIGLDAGKVRSQIRKLTRRSIKPFESSPLPRIVELTKPTQVQAQAPTSNGDPAQRISTVSTISTVPLNPLPPSESIKPLLELSLANGTVIKVFS